MHRRRITLVLALAALAPVGCKASGRVTIADPAPCCGPVVPAPASSLRIESAQPPLAPAPAALPPQ